MHTRWMSLNTLRNKKPSKSIRNQCLMFALCSFSLSLLQWTVEKWQWHIIAENACRSSFCKWIEQHWWALNQNQFIVLWRHFYFICISKNHQQQNFSQFSLKHFNIRCECYVLSILIFQMEYLFSWESFIMSKMFCNVNVINQYLIRCNHILNP